MRLQVFRLQSSDNLKCSKAVTAVLVCRTETNRSHFFFYGGAFFGGRGGLEGVAGLVFGGRRGGASTIVLSNKTALCIRFYFS